MYYKFWPIKLWGVVHYSLIITLFLFVTQTKTCDQNIAYDWDHTDTKSAFVLPCATKNNPEDMHYFLRIQQESESNPGTYSPLGGKAEENETPIETASREMLEEMPIIKQAGWNQDRIITYIKSSTLAKIVIKTPAREKYNILVIFITDIGQDDHIKDLAMQHLTKIKRTDLCTALQKAQNGREPISAQHDNGNITLRSIFFRLRPWLLNLPHENMSRDNDTYFYNFTGKRKRSPELYDSNKKSTHSYKNVGNI